MSVSLVLFTRDLRLHDNPALAAALDHTESVLPLFVLDDRILCRSGPSRRAFLGEALRDLDRSLRARGSALVVRRGDAVTEAMRLAGDVGARAVFAAEDVSATAKAREQRLADAAAGARIELHLLSGVTVVPPGDVVPAGGGDAFRVFTPYWNRWREAPRRAVLAAPATLPPVTVEPRTEPALEALAEASGAQVTVRGGETEGRRRLDRWLRDGLEEYDSRRDDLASTGTSCLSAYLHLGCVSPLEVERRAAAVPSGDGFRRQLCWRDFHHQLLASRPSLAWQDMRPRGDRWRDDAAGLDAWREGHTGYPVVDAGMRQLLAEGWMHNRARLVAASFLTKHLYLDWRLGARHFAEHLVDGDVANNVGNWQWVAGTGADTRPNRVFNPTRQALRYDPNGDYVRRWVPELATLDDARIHEPWRARGVRYSERVVEHEHAVARFREARAT